MIWTKTDLMCRSVHSVVSFLRDVNVFIVSRHLSVASPLSLVNRPIKFAVRPLIRDFAPLMNFITAVDMNI